MLRGIVSRLRLHSYSFCPFNLKIKSTVEHVEIVLISSLLFVMDGYWQNCAVFIIVCLNLGIALFFKGLKSLYLAIITEVICHLLMNLMFVLEALGHKKRSWPKSYAWTPFIHTLSNILNIFSNSMWKKDNNLPVKIKFLCHCHFINWEKSCTCRSSCRSTRVISAFIVRASRKSRAFIHAYTRNAQSVHCAQGFWRSLFMPC